jgi:hypothetical protein
MFFNNFMLHHDNNVIWIHIPNLASDAIWLHENIIILARSWISFFHLELAGIAISQKSKLNVVKCPHILKVVINAIWIWNTATHELLYYTTYRGKDKGNIWNPYGVLSPSPTPHHSFHHVYRSMTTFSCPSAVVVNHLHYILCKDLLGQIL